MRPQDYKVHRGRTQLKLCSTNSQKVSVFEEQLSFIHTPSSITNRSPNHRKLNGYLFTYSSSSSSNNSSLLSSSTTSAGSMSDVDYKVNKSISQLTEETHSEETVPLDRLILFEKFIGGLFNHIPELTSLITRANTDKILNYSSILVVLFFIYFGPELLWYSETIFFLSLLIFVSSIYRLSKSSDNGILATNDFNYREEENSILKLKRNLCHLVMHQQISLLIAVFKITFQFKKFESGRGFLLDKVILVILGIVLIAASASILQSTLPSLTYYTDMINLHERGNSEESEENQLF